MSESRDIKVLELLRSATDGGLMTWVSAGDDRFASTFGEDEFEIEIIHLQRSQEDSCERALVRISGRSIYQTYAIGTTGYHRVMSILRCCVHGWREGSEGAERKLGALYARLEKRIAEQDSGEQPATRSEST